MRSIISKTKGKAIIHTHDWMAGGIISAFAKKMSLPILHTIHNSHTGLIPEDLYSGVNLSKFDKTLYYSNLQNRCIDSQATAIKNSSLISIVGKKFLEEIVNDYFLDRSFIPHSVRSEIKEKYRHNSALVIPNGISSDLYPENQIINQSLSAPGLADLIDSNTFTIQAKINNLIKFQKKIGLKNNPNAILLFWPSRLDPIQKGIELLDSIVLKFVKQNSDVQIAIIGDPVGENLYYYNRFKNISRQSNGQIAFSKFNQDLCMLGYAAASDVFGASLYEPFGQIDVLGNIYGATATNRDTGGYHDKIKPLSIMEWGAPQDVGNGVLFKDYSPSGLEWGLQQTINHHRFFREHVDIWERQVKRIITESRKKWSLDNMVAGYITTYLNLKKKLTK